MKKYISIVGFAILLSCTSCAVEKYNLSPLSNSLAPENDREMEEIAEFSLANNVNGAEITQLVNTFPSFNNDAVDRLVSNLKIYLSDYLQALKAKNNAGKKRSLENIEQSYRKIQQLRKFLDADYNEVLNRYLVRIKTNISEIETLSKN